MNFFITIEKGYPLTLPMQWREAPPFVPSSNQSAMHPGFCSEINSTKKSIKILTKYDLSSSRINKIPFPCIALCQFQGSAWQ